MADTNRRLHQHSILGYNYRLSEIHCALGCAQMRRIGEILTRRDQVARKYDELLRDVSVLCYLLLSCPTYESAGLCMLCGWRTISDASREMLLPAAAAAWYRLQPILCSDPQQPAM